MKCPKCGSTNCHMTISNNTKVHTRSHGYGFLSGCCGWLIMGPVGLLCGLCGSRRSHSWTETKQKEYWVCQECGAKFTASESEKSTFVPAKFYFDHSNDFLEYQENPLIKKFVKMYAEKWSTSQVGSDLIIRKNGNERFEKHKNLCEAGWFENMPIIFAWEEQTGVILTVRSIIIDTVCLTLDNVKHIAIQSNTIYIESFCIRFLNPQKAELFYQMLQDLFEDMEFEYCEFEEYTGLLNYLQNLPESKLINQSAHFSSQEEYAKFVRNLTEQGLETLKERRPRHYQNYIQAKEDKDKLTTPATVMLIVQIIAIFLLHLLNKGFLNAILFTTLWGGLLIFICSIYFAVVEKGFKKKTAEYLPKELKALIQENENTNIAKTGAIRAADVGMYSQLDGIFELKDISAKASIRKKTVILYIILAGMFIGITGYQFIKLTAPVLSEIAKRVSSGYLGYYNDITVGDMFSEVLPGGSWHDMGKDNGGYSIIQYAVGDQTIIQFKAKPGEQDFTVSYMKYKGETMSEASDAKLKLDSLYGEYYKRHPALGSEENNSWDNITTDGHFTPVKEPKISNRSVAATKPENKVVPTWSLKDDPEKVQVESISNSFEDYILPDSDSRYLTNDDLIGLDQDILRLARNEIYARHGRLFQTEDLNNYFSSKPWYYGYLSEEEFDDSVLNNYEKANLDTIKNAESGFQPIEGQLSRSINIEDVWDSEYWSDGVPVTMKLGQTENGYYLQFIRRDRNNEVIWSGVPQSYKNNEHGGLIIYAVGEDFFEGISNSAITIEWNSPEEIDHPNIYAADNDVITGTYSY